MNADTLRRDRLSGKQDIRFQLSVEYGDLFFFCCLFFKVLSGFRLEQ